MKIQCIVRGKRKDLCILLFILFISTALRFYNYENRWGLAYDQARDVLVARYALATHQIPLIGPFASAGQFVYGPQWFWILMVMSGLYSKAVLTPWIMLTLLYVFMVYIMFLIGKEIGGTYLGLLAAIFACVSTAQIGQATNLTSPSMAGVFSVLTVYFFIRYIKYSNSWDAFLLGFGIANAINIHFQASGLLMMLPVGIVLGDRSLKRFLLLILGFVIPFIPLILFDFKTHFFESRNIIDYYLYGQYKIYVPNRWLTYAGVFWPSAWSRVIGGHAVFGYVILVVLGVMTLYSLMKQRIAKELFSILLTFAFVVVMLRYYRGPLFDTYLAFLHPFVLLLSAWGVYQIFKLQKVVGILLISILILGSMQLNIREIQNATNQTAIEAVAWKSALEKKFPNDSFAIYDYTYTYRGKSLPLVLFLSSENKLNDNGKKIGLTIATSSAELESTYKDYPVLYGEMGGYQLFDLSASQSSELSRKEWAFVNSSQVYEATENWYKNEKR